MISVNDTLKAKMLSASLTGSLKPRVFIQIGDDDNPLTNGNLYIGNYEYTESPEDIRWLGILKTSPIIEESIPIDSGIASGDRFAFVMYDIVELWQMLQSEEEITMVLRGLGGFGYAPVRGFGEGGFIEETKYLSQKLFIDLQDEIEDKPVYVYLIYGAPTVIPDSDNTLLIKKGKIKSVLAVTSGISIECLNSIMELNRMMPLEDHKVNDVVDEEKDLHVPVKSDEENIPTIYGDGEFPLKWIDDQNQISGALKYEDSTTSPLNMTTYDDTALTLENTSDPYPLTANILVGDFVIIRHADDGTYQENRTIKYFDVGGDRKIYLDTDIPTTYNDDDGIIQNYDLDRFIIQVQELNAVQNSNFVFSPEIYNIASSLFYGSDVTDKVQREIRLLLYYEGRVFQMGDNINSDLMDFYFKNLRSAIDNGYKYNKGRKIDLSSIVTESVETDFPFRKMRKLSIYRYPYSYSTMNVKYMARGVGYANVDFNNTVLSDMIKTFRTPGYPPGDPRFIRNDFYLTCMKSIWDIVSWDQAPLFGITGKEMIKYITENNASLAEFEQFLYTLKQNEFKDFGEVDGSTNRNYEMSQRTGYQSIEREILSCENWWLLYDDETYTEVDGYSKCVDIGAPKREETLVDGKSAVDLVFWGQSIKWDEWESNLKNLNLKYPVKNQSIASEYYWNNNGVVEGRRWMGNYHNEDTRPTQTDSQGRSVYKATASWFNGQRYKFTKFSVSNPEADYLVQNPLNITDRDRKSQTTLSVNDNPLFTRQGYGTPMSDFMVYIQFPNKNDRNKWARFIKEFNINNVERFICNILVEARWNINYTRNVFDIEDIERVQQDIGDYDIERIISGETSLVHDETVEAISRLCTWRRLVKRGQDGRLLGRWDNASYKEIYRRKTIERADPGTNIMPNAFQIKRRKKPTSDSYNSLFWSDPSSPDDFVGTEPNEILYELNCDYARGKNGEIVEEQVDEGIRYFASDFRGDPTEYNNAIGDVEYDFFRDKLNIETLEDFDGLCVGVNFDLSNVHTHEFSRFGGAVSKTTRKTHNYNGLDNIKLNTLQVVSEVSPEIEDIENDFSKHLVGQVTDKDHINHRDVLTDLRSPIDRLQLPANISYAIDDDFGLYMTAPSYVDIQPYIVLDNVVVLCATIEGEENFSTARIEEQDDGSAKMFLGMFGTPSIRYSSYDYMEVCAVEYPGSIRAQINVIEKPQDIAYDLIKKYCPNVVLNDTSFRGANSVLAQNSFVPLDSDESPEVNPFMTVTPYNLKYAIESNKVFDVLKDIMISSNYRLAFDYRDRAVMIPLSYYETRYKNFSVVDGTALDKLIAGKISVQRTNSGDVYNKIELHYNYNYITSKYESYIILDGKEAKLITKNKEDIREIDRLYYNQSFDVVYEDDEGRQEFDEERLQNALAWLGKNYAHYREVKTLQVMSKGIKNFIDAWHCAIIIAENRYRRKYIINFPMTHGGFLYQPGDIIEFSIGNAEQLSNTGLDTLSWEITDVKKDLNLSSFKTNITAVQILGIRQFEEVTEVDGCYVEAGGAGHLSRKHLLKKVATSNPWADLNLSLFGAVRIFIQDKTEYVDLIVIDLPKDSGGNVWTLGVETAVGGLVEIVPSLEFPDGCPYDDHQRVNVGGADVRTYIDGAAVGVANSAWGAALYVLVPGAPFNWTINSIGLQDGWLYCIYKNDNSKSAWGRVTGPAAVGASQLIVGGGVGGTNNYFEVFTFQSDNMPASFALNEEGIYIRGASAGAGSPLYDNLSLHTELITQNG